MSSSVHHLTVGPVRFVLRGGGGGPVRYDNWPYRDFFAAAESADVWGGRVELAVQLVQGGRACPTAQPLYAAGGNWAVWPDGDGWLFSSGFSGREVARVTCQISRALDRATLYVDGDPCDAPLRYPLDQVLSWGLLGQCGGLLLHAAAVVRNGGGYVLAGRSGVGKSTLSSLCHAAGWDILNDERVVLSPGLTGWQLSGTPWHSSGQYAQNRTVPLRAVYLLEQDVTDCLEALSAHEARLAMLPVSGIPWFENDWSQRALNALDRLTREVTVQRFCFTRSGDAVRMLETQAVGEAG